MQTVGPNVHYSTLTGYILATPGLGALGKESPVGDLVVANTLSLSFEEEFRALRTWLG